MDNKDSIVDVYKDWAPEEIKLLVKAGRYGKTHSEEFKKRQSERNRGSLNPNYGKHHSKRVLKIISEANLGRPRGPQSEAHRKKISEAHMGQTHSEATRKKISLAKLGCPSWALGRPQSEESRRKNSETHRLLWANLTEEEKEKRLRNSFLSDESIRKGSKSRGIRPTKPEKEVDEYLQRKYPGEWVYNGDFSQGIMIGGKTPDFVNVNGKKEVIEVFGGIGHFHFWDDEKVWIEHYAKYGFKCHVIWEWDVGNLVEMEKILA